MTEERRPPPGLVQRFAALPLWVRLTVLVVLVAVVALISKWLVLIFLIALGLWPITLLIALGVLALVSRRRGGWAAGCGA